MADISRATRRQAIIRTNDGNPDSKVRGENMGPTWVLAAPDGPHVGPMSLAIRKVHWRIYVSLGLNELKWDVNGSFLSTLDMTPWSSLSCGHWKFQTLSNRKSLMAQWLHNSQCEDFELH